MNKNLAKDITDFFDLCLNATLASSFSNSFDEDDIPQKFRKFIVEYVNTDITSCESLAKFLVSAGYVSEKDS